MIECVLTQHTSCSVYRSFFPTSSEWAPGDRSFLSPTVAASLPSQTHCCLLQTSKRLMSTCPQPCLPEASQFKPHLQRRKKKELISVTSALPDWEFLAGKFSQHDSVALSSSLQALWVFRKTDDSLFSIHLLLPKHTHTYTPHHHCPR